MDAAQGDGRGIRRFARLPPLVKLGIWLALTVVSAGVAQAVAWGLGLGGGIRLRLPDMALLSIFVVMALDGWPAGEYGLAAGRHFLRRFLKGFAVAAGAGAAYCGLALFLGVLVFRTDGAGQVFRAVKWALNAFPHAVIHQVVCSGYVVTILRRRHGRWTSVLLPALAFAALGRLGDAAAPASLASWRLPVGRFLMTALAGLLRLHAGSVVLPAGFVTGCLFLYKLQRELLVLGPAPDELAAWVAPGGDVLSAPLAWLVLGAGIAAFGLSLRRRGQADPTAPPPEADAAFKRVFPLSNLSMMAPLDVWLGRLADARLRVGARYVARLAAILVCSAWNTVLSLPERLLLPLLLRSRPVLDPVVIVGVHRTGTTHMHNLLALDERFCTPQTCQAMNPAGHLFSGWLIAPLLRLFMAARRPMDAVRVHFFAPQEDEFLLAGLSRLSPYWGFTFPRRWAAYDRYFFGQRFSPRERQEWQGVFLGMLRGLTFWSGKRPLLKNPCHTARASMLLEVFPNAKFIHMVRHPYDVYRSNVHFAREGHVIWQLQDPDEADSYEARFLDNYRAIEEAFYRQTAHLPAGQVVEVRFEDLQRDAVGQVRRVREQLGLGYPPSYPQRVERYLEEISGYRMNRFEPLGDRARRDIDGALGTLMDRWGYGRDGSCRPGRPTTSD